MSRISNLKIPWHRFVLSRSKILKFIAWFVLFVVFVFAARIGLLQKTTIGLFSLTLGRFDYLHTKMSRDPYHGTWYFVFESRRNLSEVQGSYAKYLGLWFRDFGEVNPRTTVLFDRKFMVMNAKQSIEPRYRIFLYEGWWEDQDPGRRIVYILINPYLAF